ncbi:unnamed protein product, partial [Mesorhabditis belari]|uniref:Ribosome biogenesis protein BRX1 homolog n=1 Tax=Mesorhabditis belari TaxID=2138241 RepID=A0AAF3EBJ0_9BILA
MGKAQKLLAIAPSRKIKEESDGSESESSSDDESVEQSDTKKVSNSKWTNRTRVLIFCSRGSDFRTRHLMKDLCTLMPHTKSETKFDKKASLSMINEIAEMKNCSKVMYFESRKHKDHYLWLSNVESGPSMKFLVHNVHTMDELKMSGNCLKASRPILSFDSTFDEKPHLAIIKRSLTQIFSTPNYHPRSQPFVDHVFTFSVSTDDKIWFRNFQVVDESLKLQEIGPRFVLELIRVFNGSFEGAVLYDNPNYESPNDKRRVLKLAHQNKYANRKLNEKMQDAKEIEVKAALKEKVEDPAGEIFNTEALQVSEEARKGSFSN